MKKITILLVIVLISTSCASIICGTKQNITFSSTPTDAIIYDNGFQIGRTPLSAGLERKKEHSISIKLDGYKPYEIIIRKTFNEWYLGNIIFGGIIGLVIDPITGALYKLTPDQITAELSNNSQTSIKEEGKNIYIAVSLTKNPDWEQIGSLQPVNN